MGTGPGGLQLSYSLRRLGIEHALLSRDDAPGGMFRRFPLFQRLISWTKPYAVAERGTRAYQWFDWNTLLADEPHEQASVWEFMDGTSYYPRREEMELGLAAFADRAGVIARYGCEWTGTRKEGEGLVVETTDGEYACDVAVFAIGMTEPWKPTIEGLDAVPHYVDCKKVDAYTGKRVFIVGKRNSGFEVADGLLPIAKQLILGSPSPAKWSVIVRSLMGSRARYILPYEDHLLAGGAVVLDAAIQRVERTEGGWRVHTAGTTIPGEWTFDVDDVIAATGFTAPLGDLPKLGVSTFMQDRLPVQSTYWESMSVPGIYFAGSVTQGQAGLKKYGISSNSAAVHGFRYNAVVLARHLAETRFGIPRPRRALNADEVTSFLLTELSEAGELWNQKSYLARTVTFDPQAGIVDDGIVPLANFVDSPGPDAVAVTVETDDTGDIHPAVYVRRAGRVEDHAFPTGPLREFGTDENRAQVDALLAGLLR
ncbi:MAG: NAD(P)-binding domain-containing protein [Actinomycetota bacterium]